jgi:hypothetical protein
MTNEEILATEFSEDFVEGMRKRMLMSYYKYGEVAFAFPNRIDALYCLKERLDKYEETHNTEWLLDVANFAMCEFMFPRYKDAYFRATDSDESPGHKGWDMSESTQHPNICFTKRRGE